MNKDLKHYHLLVIEDNPGDQLLIAEYLLDFMSNSQISNVSTFAEAKAILQGPKLNFDIILLDLTLPDKRGESLIREIVTLSNNVPVIVLTGLVDMDFSIKSMSLGISDYLIKDELNAMVLYKSVVYNIERNKNTRSIRESEKRYSDLFHLSPLPMIVYELTTQNLLDVNEAACVHYGYTYDEFGSSNLNKIEIDKEKKLDGNFKVSAVNEGLTKNGIYRHKKKSGQIIYVNIKSNKIYYKGTEAMLLLCQDITESKLFQEKMLAVSHAAEEKEKSRISRDIHDGLQQTLLSSLLHFESIKELVNILDKGHNQRFLNGIAILRKSIDETREISHTLMPKSLQDFGLVASIKNLINQFNSTTLFHFDQNLGERRLSENIEIALFRVVQEASNNIIKYSQAHDAYIQLNIDEKHILLNILDNGVGFDMGETNAIPETFGFASMQSRVLSLGGYLTVNTTPGKGTEIRIEIDFHAE